MNEAAERLCESLRRPPGKVQTTEYGINICDHCGLGGFKMSLIQVFLTSIRGAW